MLVFTAVTGEGIKYWRLCETKRRVGMDKDVLARKCCRRDHYYYTEIDRHNRSEWQFNGMGEKLMLVCSVAILPGVGLILSIHCLCIILFWNCHWVVSLESPVGDRDRGNATWYGRGKNSASPKCRVNLVQNSALIQLIWKITEHKLNKIQESKETSGCFLSPPALSNQHEGSMPTTQEARNFFHHLHQAYMWPLPHRLFGGAKHVTLLRESNPGSGISPCLLGQPVMLPVTTFKLKLPYLKKHGT